MDEYVILVFDELVYSTNMAHLIYFGDQKEWIPRSQVDWIDEETGEVSVAQWLVEDRGLEGYEV